MVWLFLQCAGVQGRQVVDVVAILRLCIHNVVSWPICDEMFIVKLDIMQAFDKLYLSVIIRVFESLFIPQWLILAYMKTLVGCCIKPFINGKPGPPVSCERGLRQGRTDSMKVFCLCISFLLQPLMQQWHRRGYGLLLGVSRIIAL
eukprot:11166052-Karenia_brevis.AAC.1